MDIERVRELAEDLVDQIQQQSWGGGADLIRGSERMRAVQVERECDRAKITVRVQIERPRP